MWLRGALVGLDGPVRGLAIRDAVPVLVAERTRRVLGESIAIALAVCRAKERRDDFEIPLAHVDRLPPKVGEAEVDVELEKVET